MGKNITRSGWGQNYVSSTIPTPERGTKSSNVKMSEDFLEGSPAPGKGVGFSKKRKRKG